MRAEGPAFGPSTTALPRGALSLVRELPRSASSGGSGNANRDRVPPGTLGGESRPPGEQ
jgi:hypothetical protein